MKSLPAWSRSLILLGSPLSPLVARGCGVGVIGRACSGESRPLVWGHKTVSLCVSAVLQGQKDMPCSDTHTQTHTHTLRDLFTHPLAPDNQCSYLGKVIICSCVCLLAFRALSCRLWGETETVASLLDSFLLGFTVIFPDYQTNMIPLAQTSDFNNLLQLTDIDQLRKRRWFQSLFFFLS